MKTSPGFSLIECIVAALVLSAGLLGTFASLTAMQQLGQLGRRTAGAAEVAASRLSMLRATACDAPTAGTTAGDYAERWTVTTAPLLRALTVEVTFAHGNRARTVRFDETLGCTVP